MMVAILLIGIIATIGIPRFFRSPVSKTEQFIGKLNSLVQQGVRTAQETSAAQRILFNPSARSVEVQSLKGQVTDRMVIPEQLEISDVIINGKSQLTSGATVYFLINPDGISQRVTLAIIDRALQPRGGMHTFSLNPFTVVFRLA